jgi:ribosomal protein S28E/S33
VSVKLLDRTGGSGKCGAPKVELNDAEKKTASLRTLKQHRNVDGMPRLFHCQ